MHSLPSRDINVLPVIGLSRFRVCFDFNRYSFELSKFDNDGAVASSVICYRDVRCGPCLVIEPNDTRACGSASVRVVVGGVDVSPRVRVRIVVDVTVCV